MAYFSWSFLFQFSHSSLLATNTNHSASEMSSGLESGRGPHQGHGVVIPMIERRRDHQTVLPDSSGTIRMKPNPSSSCMQQASRRTFARYSYQARRRWCNGQARSLGDCPSPTCDKMRRFVSAENPCRPGRPRDGDFSAAARNSSQVLAHSRVTLLFFRPRLGEMLQDAGQPQHGGAPGGFYDQARAWRLERRDFAQRSTYFEVKAGRGGKRARRRVDRYLRKLQI